MKLSYWYFEMHPESWSVCHCFACMIQSIKSLMKGKVQTVLGSIDPDLLGMTLTHEHLHHDLPKELFRQPFPPQLSHLKNHHIVMENLGWIRQYPYCFDENHDFSGDELIEDIKEEMLFFKRCGGGAIVDNGSVGVRAENQHVVLKRLSEDSGVNIILGTGFYVEQSQKYSTLGMSIEEMAKFIRNDIMTGVAGTDIKCGVIGEIGCSWPLMDFEKKSLISSAMIQEETGCPVIIHPGRSKTAPEEIVRIYQEAGGNAERVVMAHLDRTLIAEEDLLEFASLGTFCEFDLFGIEISHYQNSEIIDMPSDAQRIALIRSLVKEGFLNKVLLSHDIHTKHRLVKYGGHGYSHILVNVIPKMLKRGLTDEAVKCFLTENPKKWLTFQ